MRLFPIRVPSLEEVLVEKPLNQFGVFTSCLELSGESMYFHKLIEFAIDQPMFSHVFLDKPLKRICFQQVLEGLM